MNINEYIINKSIKVSNFFKDYIKKPSPIHNLNINNTNVIIKDESSRLGQKSFKALGSSYAISQEIIHKYNLDPNITFQELIHISSTINNKINICELFKLKFTLNGSA